MGLNLVNGQAKVIVHNKLWSFDWKKKKKKKGRDETGKHLLITIRNNKMKVPKCYELANVTIKK